MSLFLFYHVLCADVVTQTLSPVSSTPVIRRSSPCFSPLLYYLSKIDPFGYRPIIKESHEILIGPSAMFARWYDFLNLLDLNKNLRGIKSLVKCSIELLEDTYETKISELVDFKWVILGIFIADRFRPESEYFQAKKNSLQFLINECPNDQWDITIFINHIIPHLNKKNDELNDFTDTWMDFPDQYLLGFHPSYKSGMHKLEQISRSVKFVAFHLDLIRLKSFQILRDNIQNSGCRCLPSITDLLDSPDQVYPVLKFLKKQKNLLGLPYIEDLKLRLHLFVRNISAKETSNSVLEMSFAEEDLVECDKNMEIPLFLKDIGNIKFTKYRDLLIRETKKKTSGVYQLTTQLMLMYISGLFLELGEVISDSSILLRAGPVCEDIEFLSSRIVPEHQQLKLNVCTTLRKTEDNDLGFKVEKRPIPGYVKKFLDSL
jgi:hypothetical protein